MIIKNIENKTAKDFEVLIGKEITVVYDNDKEFTGRLDTVYYRRAVDHANNYGLVMEGKLEEDSVWKHIKNTRINQVVAA